MTPSDLKRGVVSFPLGQETEFWGDSEERSNVSGRFSKIGDLSNIHTRAFLGFSIVCSFYTPAKCRVMDIARWSASLVARSLLNRARFGQIISIMLSSSRGSA